MTVNRFLASAILAAAPWLLLSGCAVNRYRAPITGFGTAAGTAISTAEQIYLTSNKVERDHYIDEQAADKQVIDPQELNKMRRAFSEDDIRARIEALGVLRDYTALLLQLATSDAPAQAATQVAAVETSLNALVERAGGLCANPGCTAGNTAFRTTVTNVSGALQPILRGILTAKIQRGLDQSIQTAEKPVADLIDTIRKDIASLQERRRQSLSAAWSHAVRLYNDEAKKPTPDTARLAALAERIKTGSDRQDQLTQSNPDRALAAMNRAHQALVRFSKQGKSPATLAEVADAVNTFATEAQLAGQAIRALSGI